MKITKKKVILFILAEFILLLCMIFSSHPLRIFMIMVLLLGMGLCFIPSSYFKTEIPKNNCFKWTTKTIAILGITAIGVITICSKSSPLYPFNDWVDSNVYMTMGRAILKGRIPYRDLYEHKGFIVYAIHALAALISRTNFLGVWLIEIFAAFFFLYYSFRSLWLFCGERTYTWIPILAVIVYVSVAFCHGDSAEEFCLPLLAYGLWVGLKAVILKRFPTSWECFAIGLTSGCILWIKYTLLGFYLGWFVTLILLLPKEKLFIQIWNMVWKITLGVGIITLPWLFWFMSNNALSDLFTVYFYDNLTYAATHKFDNQILNMVWNICRGCQEIWRNHTVAAILIFIGLIYLFRTHQHTIASFFIGTILPLWIVCYIGGQTYKYYALPFSIFIIVGLVMLDCLFCQLRNFLKSLDLQKYGINKRGRKRPSMSYMKHFNVYFPIEFVVCMLAAFLLSSNTYMLSYQKSDLPQYQFRDIILQTPNATLLEYNTMDIGIYTVCDIVPEFRYFCCSNMKKTEIDQAQDSYLESGLADYVVIMLSDMVSEGNLEIMSKIEAAGYACVSYTDYFNGENPHVYLLYALSSKVDNTNG